MGLLEKYTFIIFFIALYVGAVCPSSILHNITSHKARNFHSDTCCICLGNIKAGEFSTVLPCEHVFHTKCIRRWLRKSATCPHCRFHTCIMHATGDLHRLRVWKKLENWMACNADSGFACRWIEHIHAQVSYPMGIFFWNHQNGAHIILKRVWKIVLLSNNNTRPLQI